MQTPELEAEFQSVVRTVGSIPAVPLILDVLCQSTGMGFAAVARVTEERWIACSVRDDIGFGLLPGGELKVATTLCHEVHRARETIAIDHVAEDTIYCGHHTPAMYGFQSYVSTPIVLSDGSFFGTLCAIDPRPATVRTPQTLGMFKLFAELIAAHLDAMKRLDTSETTLREERATAELREQFIAVVGHDLRTPLTAIAGSAELLSLGSPDPAALASVNRIDRSVKRMTGLIDDMLDFARGRLGGGLSLNTETSEPIESLLLQVVAELRSANPTRQIEVDIEVTRAVPHDRSRMGQLFSNLLTNAATHGSSEQAIVVAASTDGGVFTFSVSNGGKAMDEATVQRLFQPFFRGFADRGQQGLGLGLYIAAEIARAHGGSLDVESNPEVTRFTFGMPLG